MPSRRGDSEASAPVGRRYVLTTQIGRGGMGEVWQAHDRLMGWDVALKRIRPHRLDGHQGQHEVSRLGREFHMLASLHHPNVISVLDYGFDRQHWPYFTMRLLERCQTLTNAASRLGRRERIDLLIQLFDGLAYLHHRGVLHRDLKPGNVLVRGDQVHIVDFGLSIAVEETAPNQGIAGTLHYLAPEFFVGHPPSEASDLYAAGLLMHEVLTGHQATHTNERSSSGDRPVRFHQIDAEDPELGDDLGRLLTRLLARHPEERLRDHAAIIAALIRARGGGDGARGSSRIPIGEDGTSSRSVPLVGREAEFQRISTALDGAMTGNGSSLLLTGMVGSGKSRLIEELRSLAMIRGALVVSGRCPSDGAAPFAPWRPLLRLLALELDVTDRTAAILRPLVPDIETLLGCNVPSGDGDVSVARLAGAIVEVLRLRRRTVVMILEDLHWAGAESHELFAAIGASCGDLPVLLVSTARHDETPEIAARLGDPPTILLTPLSGDAILSLTEAALGPAGRTPAVRDLVVRASEGNPLLAVEILRTVIEQAGGWDRVESAPLPDMLVVGGMRGLVARRLRRLDPQQVRLLEIAALIGRDVDMEIAEQIEPAAPWTDMLGGAIRQGILEVHAGQCQFVHDQLRQAVIDGVDGKRRRDLHRRIAEVLETRTGCRAGELAHHWRQAEEPHREAVWAHVAGHEALQNGAYRQALDLLERVIDLKWRHGRGFPDAVPIDEIRFLAGDAALRAGQFDRCREHMGHLLGLRLTDDGGGLRRGIALAMEAATQALHRVLPTTLMAARPGIRDHRMRIARAWEAMARIGIYYGDGTAILLAALRAANRSESAGRPLVFAQSLLGCTAASLGGWRVADGYFQRGRHEALAVNDHIGICDSLVMEGACLLGAGRLDEAIGRLHDARQHADRADYALGRGQATVVEGVCHGYLGDLTAMLACEQRGLDEIRHHSRGHQAGFRAGCALALIHLGRFTEARAELERAHSMVSDDDRISRALIAAELCMVHLREGDLGAAIAADGIRAELLAGFTAIPQPCAQVFEAPCELLVTRLWSAHRENNPGVALWRQAKRLDRDFAAWARLFPIGRPLLGWFRGHLAAIRGDLAGALRSWTQSRDEAARFRLPLAEATVLIAIAEHGPFNQRAVATARARTLAAACRARWHLARLGAADPLPSSAPRIPTVRPPSGPSAAVQPITIPITRPRSVASEEETRPLH